MKKQVNRPAYGFTLIELMIVISVIAIMVGAVVFVLAKEANKKKDISIAKTQIMTISAAAQQWKAGQTSYANVSMTVLCQDDLLNKNLCNDNYLNPWGGNYSIAPTGPGNVNYTITATGVKTGSDQALGELLAPVSQGQASSTGTGGTVTVTFGD